MDNIPPEVVSPEVPVEPVVVPAPASEASVSETPPEPPPKPPRRYLKRVFGFNMDMVDRSVFIQGNLYEMDRDVFNVDGLYGDIPYDSIGDLATKASFTPQQLKLFNDQARRARR